MEAITKHLAYVPRYKGNQMFYGFAAGEQRDCESMPSRDCQTRLLPHAHPAMDAKHLIPVWLTIEAPVFVSVC